MVASVPFVTLETPRLLTFTCIQNDPSTVVENVGTSKGYDCPDDVVLKSDKEPGFESNDTPITATCRKDFL